MRRKNILETWLVVVVRIGPADEPVFSPRKYTGEKKKEKEERVGRRVTTCDGMSWTGA